MTRVSPRRTSSKLDSTLKTKSSTKVRVLTGILALLFFFSIFFAFGSIGLTYLILAISPFMAWEYAKISLRNYSVGLKFFFTGFSFFIVLMNTPLANVLSGILLPNSLSFYMLLFSLFFFISFGFLKEEQDLPFLLDFFSLSALGFIYCALLVVQVLQILNLHGGHLKFLCLLAIVFGGDTFAYFVGKKIGRRKLAKWISPNKTLEGSLGGLLGSCVGSVLVWSVYFQNQPIGAFLSLALVCGVLAQFGDLFESLLKRVADVKDSGSIMPGHGGFLDRFDGVLFAAPLFLYMSRYFFV